MTFKKKVVYVVSAVAFVLLFVLALLLSDKLGKGYDKTDSYIKPKDKISQNKDDELQENGDDVESEAEEQDDNDSDSKLAADFVVYDGKGNPVKLSSKFGKPIVINFWATWCGPCKNELPYFEAMYNKYKEDVCFMMVNLTDGESQTRSIVDDFVKVNEYTFPVYYDETLMAAYVYGASSVPLTVFIYDDGSIYGGRYGAMEQQELEYYIKDILEN